MLAPRAVKRKAAASAGPSSLSSGTPKDAQTAAAPSNGVATDREVSATGSDTDKAVDNVQGTATQEAVDTSSLDCSAPSPTASTKEAQRTGKEDFDGTTIEATTSRANDGAVEDAATAGKTDVDDEQEQEQQQQHEREREDKLALLAWTVDECCSDWGLTSQHQALLRKFGLSSTGYVHISSLLPLPPVAAITTTMADITAALRQHPSSVVELDDTGFQVRRKLALDFESLSQVTEQDWAERTVYIENIPLLPKGTTRPLPALRTFLEELVGCPVSALRLPPLYDASSEAPAGVASASQYPSTAALGSSSAFGSSVAKGKARQMDQSKSNESPGQRNKRLKSYQIPLNGGPFKGFAFAVFDEADRVRAAMEKHSWDERGKMSINTTAEEDDDDEAEDYESDKGEAVEQDVCQGGDNETQIKGDSSEAHDRKPDHKIGPEDHSSIQAVDATLSVEKDATNTRLSQESPEVQAVQAGLRIMPITTFNALKNEYLAYFKDINALREEHEYRKTRQNSFKSGYGKGRRSASPEAWRDRQGGSSRRERRAQLQEQAADRKQEKMSAERWTRKEISPDRAPRRFDATEDDFPRGCVVFFKRFDPKVLPRTLKALLQAILEREEIDTEKLLYVDHLRGVNSSHIRFADAATATFFASYFSSPNPRRRYLHTNPDSTDPTEAFSYAEEEVRTVEAEVMSGTPEVIYWSKVPQSARQAYKKKGDDNSGNAADTPAAEDGDEENDSSPKENARGKGAEPIQQSKKRSAADGDGDAQEDQRDSKHLRFDDGESDAMTGPTEGPEGE